MKFYIPVYNEHAQSVVVGEKSSPFALCFHQSHHTQILVMDNVYSNMQYLSVVLLGGGEKEGK